jgi:UDP:flavonoid glycosyltransferase YjiC (YdhE family)
MTSSTSNSLEVEDGQEESLSRLLLRENKHYRELRRIRSSLAFRLGTSIVRALKFPPKLLLLPFTLLFVGFDWGLERIGKKKFISEASHHHHPVKNRHCVVMFPTNGVGFGHFTRLLAIAKRMKKLDSTLEVVFFSTMPTMHLLKEHGILGYRLPGRKEYNDTSASEWNAMVEENLALVFAAHRPSMFVFDGAYPYRGMLNAIKGRSGLEKIWVRRGTFKKNATNIPVDSLVHFDHVVRPKDSVPTDISREVLHDVEVSHCEPIVFLDEDELLSREDALSRLGIRQNMFVVYIQLGAGNINSIGSIVTQCLDILSQKKNVHVVIGESMIGSRLSIKGDRVQVLRDYPNSWYFNGFDVSIIAGGYNSFHEVVHHKLPSICIPNTKTGMDDQLARANAAGSAGAMIVLDDPEPGSLADAIARILDPAHRDQMKKAMADLNRSNGAAEVADFFTEMLIV